MASFIILHIDMDAFFASVEELDNPSLRGRCVIVGGQSQRGVVAAASYEARKFGIHSAMPIFQARLRCKDLVIVPPRRKRYAELSDRIMSILRDFSPLVEPVSIDEAFVDLTGCHRLYGDPGQTARAMKARIRSEIGLTCSVGVAPNKFLAKIASDLEKPDGLSIITPDQVRDFVDTLPIHTVPGVGRHACRILQDLGILTLGQANGFPEELLVRKMGKFAHRLLELARGQDLSAVTPHGEAKSVSTETTLSRNTQDRNELSRYLLSQSQTLARELRRKSVRARTISLILKTADFQRHSRSQTLGKPVQSAEQIYQTALGLLKSFSLVQPVRLVGVGAGSLQPADRAVQAELFPDALDKQNIKWEKVDRAMDAVTDRFGEFAVKRGNGHKID
jgi:DNA polymerase-4